MYRKSNKETDITICKIGSQWEFAVWLRKRKQGLCINLEGWDGEGDGREVQNGGTICITMVDCEKAECPGIDASELWYWRRLLRVPWTAR